MKKPTLHYRQGDVLIVKVDALPADLKTQDRENGRVILAHGERTGHAHAIHDKQATLLKGADGRVFLSIVDETADLVHEEHSTIHIEPGDYGVIIQTEYSPEELRNVAD